MAGIDAARYGALMLLAEVAQGRTLAEALAGTALGDLPGPDRARAQRLALATLRHGGRVARFLKPFLRRHPPEDVALLLRLAVVEMRVEGAPAHAVVSNAVAIAQAAAPAVARFAPLVNAVLRKAATAAPEAWDRIGPPEMPGWLRGRLMSAYGKAAVLRMEAAHLAGAPLDLTPRAPQGAEPLAAQLGAEVLPTGSLRLAPGGAEGARGAISDLPGYAGGEWWVQDAAAALAARALAPAPGARVLDLCAAPGGKTMQLAAAGARVTALDVSAARLGRLRENLARTGLAAEVIAADLFDHVPSQLYDAVLLDAPCTATGTLRRHPELPFVRAGSDVKAWIAGLAETQARMIDRALALLGPGGRLTYCTCSLLPEEGEGQIAAALARHPGLRVLPPDLPGIAPEWITDGGGLRLRPDFWPERGGMDGFFIATLAFG